MPRGRRRGGLVGGPQHQALCRGLRLGPRLPHDPHRTVCKQRLLVDVGRPHRRALWFQLRAGVRRVDGPDATAFVHVKPNRAPNRPTNRTPNSSANSTPNSSANSAANSTNSIPNRGPNRSPDNTPNRSANRTADFGANRRTHSERTTHVEALGRADERADGRAHGRAERAAHGGPDPRAHDGPDRQADRAPHIGAHGPAIHDADGGPDVAPYLAADVRADGRAHDAAEPPADADADARAVDLARADDLRLRVRDRGALSDDQRVAGRRARGRPRPGLRRPGVWKKTEKSRGARPRRRGAAQREQVRRAAQQHDGGCLRGRAADHLPVGPDRRLGTQGPALRVRRRPRAAIRPAHLHGPRPLRERRARQRHGQPHGRLSGCRGAPRRLPSTWIGSRRRRRGRACFRRPTSVRRRRSRRVGHTAARLARRRGPGLTAPADARRRRKDPTRRRRAALGSARGATTA